MSFWGKITSLDRARARSDDKLAQGEERRKKKGWKEGRKEGGKGREEGVAPLLKSRDLHLAGGGNMMVGFPDWFEHQLLEKNDQRC